MAVTLGQLRVFLEVADLGNIKDAAEKIGRTPSAVSMSLKQLEEQLDGALFESDRKTRLTSLGEYVLTVARAEVRGFDRSVAAIQSYARNEIGRLDVACVPSVATQIMPRLLRTFLSERPDIELDVRDADSASVELAIERQRVELGVAGRPSSQGIVAFAPVFRDRFVMVCAAESPLAASDAPVSAADLAGYRFIANGASVRLQDAGFRSVSQASRLMVRNVTSLLALVRSDFGVTVLPALSVAADTKVHCRPLAGEGLHREVGLLWRAGHTLSPVADAFAEAFRACIRDGEIDVLPA
ncbi:LysR family transcriptional regulator [Amorphus orientalis]|uniref:DNA-binding transcriptional LysR family regulator n=1 Tax=Amorphus orientalis TaxID=649198 RepID=A0AAE4ARY2_9HYPH|nr:LysR family transcriptional regulator [Amorphus orientalis]MDQ0315596.1 DNA-binding transcriptional LysR family regulator [Amorphus orientalis]